MNSTTADIVKSLIPVLSVVLGAWLGSHYTLRNSLRSLEAQNAQRLREWERENATKEEQLLRDWFESYAIADCIDPLLEDITRLQSTVVSAYLDGSLEPGPERIMPDKSLAACVRLFTLTGSCRFTLLLQVLYARRGGETSKENCTRVAQSLNSISLMLIRLRQYVTSTDIHAKSDVYKLCNEERFKSIGAGMDSAATRILSDEKMKKIGAMTEILRDMSGASDE